MSDNQPIRVVHTGVGPVGCRVLALILERTDLELVGVVDSDPQKIGCPLEEFVPQASGSGLRVEGDTTACIKNKQAVAVTHTTVSYLPDCMEHLRELARAGVATVSSTEELLYPWLRHPKWSAELKGLCQEHGSRLLGTGVNPGFLMDLLPVLAGSPCERIRAVRAERVVDAATRRGPLQKKVGAGITTDEFARRVAGGRFGHVGYCESGALLASALGWKLDTLGETIEPMIAEKPIKTEFVDVQPGHVAGIHQIVTGTVQGKEVIHLDLKMYVGAPDPHDAFTLDSDPPIAWRCAEGVAGDPATAAIVVNSIDRLLTVPPGLKTVADLPASVKAVSLTGLDFRPYY
ncbi:MAG: NAD(P)H-dependent amine dehydrogenase family protein [Planctomycetota bacterium]|jgi:4-hydroxy-tetrahydrodipicolinate reductase